MRTYDGLNSLGPLYGHRDGVLAVDVTAELLVCPDGSRIVTALVIGGMRHALDNTCRADGRRAPVQADAAPRRPVIRCSAEAWNCRPVP